jgi:hypothetical protein
MTFAFAVACWVHWTYPIDLDLQYLCYSVKQMTGESRVFVSQNNVWKSEVLEPAID